MNLEKAVNHSEHGEHGEKTKAYIVLTNHPKGDVQKISKLRLFVVPAVSLWFELRFLG